MYWYRRRRSDAEFGIFIDNSFLGNYIVFMASKAVSGLKDHLGFWLRFVSNAVSHNFAKLLKSHEVTVPEWVMLRELFELKTASIGELGRLTGMTKGAVSKVIYRLLSRKLISTSVSESDRRAQEIRLTPKGLTLVPKLAAFADTNDEKFFGCLTASEKALLREIMSKVVKKNSLSQIPIE
jgi:DNA-binding MarR family transcriptional regulator